jgi:hypothetical protein
MHFADTPKDAFEYLRDQLEQLYPSQKAAD